MKKLLLTLIFFFISMSLLNAQSNCLKYFPSNEGSELITKTYNAQNDLLKTMVYKIAKSYQYPGSSNMKIEFLMEDKNGKIVDSGDLNAFCDQNNFYLKMKNYEASQFAMNMLTFDSELVGGFWDYPTDLDNLPLETVDMGGSSFTIQSKRDKRDFKRIQIYGRQYVGTEKMDTPAGLFDAYKVTFEFEIYQNKQTIKFRGVEWFALGAGVVRSEIYDQSGTLQEYTVLTKLLAK